MNTFYVINSVLSYYGVVLAVVGTVGNVLCVLVCVSKKLRSIPTFIFLAFMTALDAMSLYYWNLNNFYLTVFGKLQMDESVEKCRANMFLQMFTLQGSAYFLVAISLERYLCIRIKTWKNSFKPKYALYVSIAIVFAIFVMNLPLLILIDFSKTNNTAITGACTASSYYKIWRPTHTYIYSIAPFLLLTVINCMLIRTVIQSRNKVANRNSEEKTKTKSLTTSIIALTVLFIVLTAPVGFAGGYFINSLLYSESGRVLLFFFTELSFTYNSSNFLILYTSNKQFSKQLKRIVSHIFYKNSIENATLATNTNIQTIFQRGNNKKTTVK